MDYFIFFTAIENNLFDSVKDFLPSNKNLDIRNRAGYTLLHAAVNQNNYEIVQYLLENCAIPINDTCNEGKTSVFLACEQEPTNINLIQLLFNYGSDVNIPNNDGVTCLHLACRSANLDLTRFLLRCNAFINALDANEYSCLHYIAISNCCVTLKLILNNIKSEIDINGRDIDGCTALMLAVDVSNTEIAKELINLGADLNIIGRGSSALHLAVVTQQSEIFEIIWQRISFEIIRQLADTNNLVKLMVKYGWFFPDRIHIMFDVLSHPDIMSILNPEIKILTVLFYRIRFVKFIHDIDVYKMVEKFIQIGVEVSQNDLRVFLLNFYRFDNNFDLLNLLIKQGHVNLDEKDMIKFTIELYPNLIPKILTFCVNNGPLDVIKYFTEILRINRDMIKLIIIMLFFCTPNFTLRKKLKEHLTNFCFALINHGEGSSPEEIIYLYKYIISVLKQQKVPSLLELSRDVVRFNIGARCPKSNDYLNVINNLILSKDIVNIINCRIAVNILQDFDDENSC